MYGHQSHIYGIATSTYAAYASILQLPLLLAYVCLRQPARAPHTANAQPLMRVPIQPITQPHRLRLTPSPAPNAIPSTQDNTHPPARAPTQLTYIRSNHTQQHTQEHTQPTSTPTSIPTSPRALARSRVHARLFSTSRSQPTTTPTSQKRLSRDEACATA